MRPGNPPVPALASAGIPGGGATGLEKLSNERLKEIANSKTVSPFRRDMARRLLALRSKPFTPPKIIV